MAAGPLVSVIVPTKNSGATLGDCLNSVRQQSYVEIELIVVDNFSTDDTAEIARKFVDQFFQRGPERSAQRNFGVSQAKGQYVLIIDSDMILESDVVAECIEAVRGPEIRAVIIPERSFGQGFWAECKALERSFYVGVAWMEAARFFDRQLYGQLGGYDEALIAGEDWDLSARAAQKSKIGRTASIIKHNEGHLKLIQTLKKKYYYASHIRRYSRKPANQEALKNQAGVIHRYGLFFSHPVRLLRQPLIGAGMIFMKTCEFTAGGIGMLISKLHDYRS